MNFSEYQEAARRTVDPDMIHEEALAAWGLGIGGESGEVLELVKKHLFHGRELSREKMKLELGDVLWYLANMASENDLTLEEIAIANDEKLRARWPEGFVRGEGRR